MPKYAEIKEVNPFRIIFLPRNFLLLAILFLWARISWATEVINGIFNKISLVIGN